MLFVFRFVNYCLLGGLFLSPLWAMNSSMDRLLPGNAQAAPIHSTPAPKMTHEQAAWQPGHILARLQDMKQEIHADMCSRPGGDTCIMGLCTSRIVQAQCAAPL